MATKLPAVERHGNGWRSEVQINGRREKITVHAPSEREAQKEVARIKDQKRLISGNLPQGALTITIHHTFDLYLDSNYVAERDGNAYRATKSIIDGLKPRFDSRHLMVDFGDEELAELVKQRSRETVVRIIDGKPTQIPISPATINRTTSEFMSRVFSWLEKTKGFTFPNMPKFRKHKKREAGNRTRHLYNDEYALLAADMRGDYFDVFRFSLLTGMRQTNTIELRRDQVRFDWDRTVVPAALRGGFARLAVKTEGHQKKVIDVALPIAACEILLKQCHEDGTPFHPIRFFTYQVQRARNGKALGERTPMTITGFRSWWGHHKKHTGIVDYRWHDNRHTAATEILKATGDITAVQKQLGHTSIATTMKYAKVLPEVQRAAVEKASAATLWGSKAA